MSSLTVEEDQKWVPTHVQVTVLRGRGLRGKGKHGTSDVYTIIQLGKEKYSTGVVEKTTEPDWREECSFELQPGVLENGGRSSYPAGSNELVLTVMHRALIGLDMFLGQAVIQLDKVFHETRYVRNEWYRLNSKTGKKEKERGEIQVTVQFTRNNLTASMYDLVMKDKSASTFGKLKERMRGKRRSSDDDSSSAVLPSGYGSLQKMRQRLPSDGGGEEDYEDDEGGEARRSKMRTFFLRGKLRKSSDTRSSTSLGSESSESSSRGGSLSPTAGISVVVSDLSNSPSNSSNLTVDNSPEHTANTSPRSSSLHVSEFGDEAGEITIAVPQQTVCVNGSHAYDVQPLDPGSGKPVDSLGLGRLLQKSLPVSVSLQNLSPHTVTTPTHPKSPVGDGRRWSFDKPDEEEKAAIAAALEKSGPMLADEDERSGQAAPHKEAASSSSSSTAELESQGKKQRRNLFSHGRSESAGKGQSQSKDESEQASAATREKNGGWFGSKDSNSKPSLVVSPTLEPSTDPHPPPLPTRPHPPGPPFDPTSLVSPLHHTNPFSHSQSTSPPMSPCNPFLSLVQHNPFYEDILTAKPLKPSLPPLPYLSSSRPPISQLFPQANNNDLTTHHSIIGTEPKSKVTAKVEKRPLPPVPTEGENTLNKKSANPFTTAGELESEWDDSFEAFAAGRLQPPEDPTTDCNTQQNLPSDCPLERCGNKGALLPITDADQNTNVNEALRHQPCTEFVLEAHKAVTNTNTHHFDTFAQFLETIPEHTSFESDNLTLNTLSACTETNQANSTTNTTDLKETSLHQPLSHASSVKLDRSSPDPSSSGLGSSAEEDFLSCLSSYSDKFSPSSSEETEAQNFESGILSFEKSPESAAVKDLKTVESEDDTADKSVDLSLVDVTQHTVIQDGDGCEKVGLDRELEPQLPVLIHLHRVITAEETGTEGGQTEAPKLSISDVSLQAESDLNSLDGTLDPQFSAFTHQQTVIPAKETGTEAEDFWLQNLSELQPKPNVSLRPIEENGEDILGEFSESVSVSEVLNDSPDQELCSAQPLLRIITSSPDPNSAEPLVEITTSERRDTSRQSPIPFGLLGGFLNTSSIAINTSRCMDETLLQTPMSDKSNSSFLQSLYVSTDSQAYQSCVSDPASKFSSESETNETLDSVNLTLCGDLSESQATAEDAQDDATKPDSAQCHQSFPRALDDTETLEPSFTTSNISGATLQRSHSEGDLTSAFQELLLPSFGSDPGAIQGSSSSAQPSPPDLPSLAAFPPSVTPDRSSSPVVLFPPPSLADATASLPTGATQATAPKPVPLETDWQRQAGYPEENSPHPVKPLTTAMLAEEKRTEGRSVLATGLEKLKSTIHPGRSSSQISEPEPERKKSLTEGAGSYYHLTHSELVALLLQREAELERQKAEFERQKFLLAKREVELKKLKPQVKDLEDYIDTLLVRIMEQKPTLLQVRSKLK